MDGPDLKREFRNLFEAQVMNHGDYSLVYAQPAGPGLALVLGYRHTPLELVLCPVSLGHPPRGSGDGPGRPVRLAGSVCSIDLTNVATVADTGSAYQVQTVTGFRTCFEVTGTPRILPLAIAALGEATVDLDQGQDAEDFHQFMGHFMDVLEGFYQVPDTIESLRTLPASA